MNFYVVQVLVKILGDKYMQPRIILYIPGFPGEAIPRINNEIRVVDIISKVLITTHLEYEIITYPGIKNDCDFTFKNALDHSLEILKSKIEKGYAVTVIAQSFGGLVALMLNSYYVLDKMLLVSPFILELEDVEIESILSEYSKELPHLIRKELIHKHSQELKCIFNNFKKMQIESSLNTEIKVLAATRDSVVPIAILDNFFVNNKLFIHTPIITRIDDDHDFTFDKNKLEEWVKENV